jgi:hypothetical protein
MRRSFGVWAKPASVKTSIKIALALISRIIETFACFAI